jgi:glycosyltransferase involved in cell wall biosynthesis
MTADTLGGVWRYAVDLSTMLCSAGCRVALTTMGAPLSDSQQAEAAAIPGLTIFESDYRLEWMSEPWRDVVRAGNWLLEIENEFKPDRVHLNGYVHAALPWRAPVLVVGHSCVLSWWRAVRGEDAPRSQWSQYEQAVTRGLRAAKIVAAPSLAMLSALRRHYGVYAGRVIYNGRNARDLAPTKKQEFIFSAGRLWDEAKNLSALDKAAAGLRWPVLVAGRQIHPDGREVRPDNLQVLGELTPSEIASHMSRASIYAMPARYEPFGLSILEAALCGCALVLGDIPSLREIWGDAAIYVPPADSQALRKALAALTDSPSKLAAAAGKAVERARWFTPQRMLAGYVDAYHQLSEYRAAAAN